MAKGPRRLLASRKNSSSRSRVGMDGAAPDTVTPSAPAAAARGREQFLGLVRDSEELRDLVGDPAQAGRVDVGRLPVELLRRRDDEFSDGEKLLVREGRWGPVAGE